MRTPTERDFRQPEFADAKIEDYEFRSDGKLVRKDRWEKTVYRIVGIVGMNRYDFELEAVIEAVIELEETANPRYVCSSPACGHSGLLSNASLSVEGSKPLCGECSFPIGGLK